MYVAQHIDYSLKGKAILQDVSLQLQPGKLTALLGPNGAGKSTLLKVLSGRVRPQKGMVLLDENPLEEIKENELALRRAVMPQRTIVQFPYTVKEIVMMGCIAHKSPIAVQEKLAIEKLNAVDFQYSPDRSYLNLSGGEQQRVQLARVLAQVSSPLHSNKYLLLDEPTSSLDIAREQQLMQIIKQLCKAGIGVLVIIHDINLAIQYADELIFMKSGRVVTSGEVMDVAKAAIIESVYDYPVKLIPTAQIGRPMVVPIPKRSVVEGNDQPISQVSINGSLALS
ncbi:MAG: heme ABC transporter ATP-binding protein [Flammeovirgaceae bacterium]